MHRSVEIRLPRFVEDGVRRVIRSGFFQAIGWNLPIVLAVVGFLLGDQSLRDHQIMEGMGFKWAVMNEKTVRAESLMLWTAAHLIVPLVLAVLYNVIYLLRPRSRAGRIIRLAVLTAFAAFCLWYFEQGFYLARKVVLI